MNIRGIHHIAIICADYAPSKAFYTQVLGFSIVRETHREQRASYKLDLAVAGHYQIELFSFPAPPARPSRPEAAGLRHLAFKVANLDEAILELQQKGVEVEPVRVDPITGKRCTFFPDPDGLPLELYEE